MEEEKGRVCVTGGTGFLGSWLVMKLLQQGYSVHTTIRPDPIPEYKRDVSFLTNLPEAEKKLKIFEADLSEPESFKPAIEGCIGVFHVATPLDFKNKETEEVVTRRAIEGTLGILKACLECSNTVKKVVYTSSSSAVQFSGKPVDLLDETFWSDVDYIKSLKSSFGPYMISKTLAEKSALEFAEQHGLNVVTVIPSFINGPFICPKFPGSVYRSLAMILGAREQYEYLHNMSMVHTDDVARAHIFLFEYGEAKGRYCCSSDTIGTIEDMSKFLSANYPEFSIPTIESLCDIKGFRVPSLTSKKLLDSGFEFKYGLKEMFDGAIKSCKVNSYL